MGIAGEKARRGGGERDGRCGGGPVVGSGFGEGGPAAGGEGWRFGRWWLAAQGGGV